MFFHQISSWGLISSEHINHMYTPPYPSIFWLVGSLPCGYVASHSFHCCITVSSCVSGDLLEVLQLTSFQGLFSWYCSFKDVYCELLYLILCLIHEWCQVFKIFKSNLVYIICEIVDQLLWKKDILQYFNYVRHFIFKFSVCKWEIMSGLGNLCWLKARIISTAASSYRFLTMTFPTVPLPEFYECK
jgi:hypothetical protein